jgi:hypothetical protein
VLRAQGRPAEALDAAREAMSGLDAGGVYAGDAEIRLVYAEALDDAGDRATARDVIRVARERVIAASKRVTDASMRESFLTNVREHARTLELARSWLDAGG